MEKAASRFRLKAGMQAEYKRRHDEIWPEMLELMRQAGIRNYTIWNDGEDLFGYFEVADFAACSRTISASEVKKRWDDYMGDLIVQEADPAIEGRSKMQLMFEFAG